MFSMKRSFSRAAGALLLGSALVLTGCFASSDDDFTLAPDLADTSASAVLAQVANGVIYPTYTDLASKAAALETAVLALDTTANAAKLNTARAAWRSARAPWEQSEGFLFGPVDSKGIDPSIDSWPLDSLALRTILGGASPLNVSYVEAQVDEVKGFHAIEFLLFGFDSSKTRLTTRELQYAKAAASYFKTRVDTLKASWDPAGGNYLAEFKNAGKGSAMYSSKVSAADELLTGMVGICDEVANGKITDPFDNGLEKEESRFSRNSTTDFANNMRSVRNVWRGSNAETLAAVPGFKAWVAAKDTALAAHVEEHIDEAIELTEAIGDFTTALGTPAGRAKIVAARSAIQHLQEMLEKDVRKAVLP